MEDGQHQPVAEEPLIADRGLARSRKKVRKELDFNLNYWNLWWKRMEREGLKEGVERMVTNMQKPASSFMMRMSDTCTGNMIRNVQAQHQSTTPLKRKSELWMDPELSGHQPEIGSPAKRSRYNFMNLVKFWDGEQGRGANGAMQYVNAPRNVTANPSSIHLKSKISKQTMAKTKTLSEPDIYLTDDGRNSDQPAEIDLEGEE